MKGARVQNPYWVLSHACSGHLFTNMLSASTILKQITLKKVLIHEIFEGQLVHGF